MNCNFIFLKNPYATTRLHQALRDSEKWKYLSIGIKLQLILYYSFWWGPNQFNGQQQTKDRIKLSSYASIFIQSSSVKLSYGKIQWNKTCVPTIVTIFSKFIRRFTEKLYGSIGWINFYADHIFIFYSMCH